MPARALRYGSWRWSLLACGLLLAAAGVGHALAPRLEGCGESPEAALASNLATLRQAIEMYRAQHDGRVPGQDGDEAEFIRQLTTATDAEGRPGGSLGPYIRVGMPANPITGGTRVLVVDRLPSHATVVTRKSGSAWECIELLLSDPATSRTGPDWIWCPSTGELRANAAGRGPSGTPYYEL